MAGAFVPRIKVTDKAKKKLEKIIQDNEGKYIRVLLQGIG